MIDSEDAKCKQGPHSHSRLVIGYSAFGITVRKSVKTTMVLYIANDKYKPESNMYSLLPPFEYLTLSTPLPEGKTYSEELGIASTAAAPDPVLVPALHHTSL